MDKLNKIKNVNNLSVNRTYGIYDPLGIYNNPMTDKPYKNIYQHKTLSLGDVSLPKTYANLGKSWSSKIVYNNKDLIIDTIINNQIILLTAGTGVGKTILVPRIALHAFDYKEKIICTIPKRLPTESTASFVAECMDVVVGEEVGYYFQGTNLTNKNGIDTKLIFTTTGSLISRMTGNDPLLSDYKCVIVDEAHERSVQTDQLLLLLKKACLERSDLKVIIMSATIELKIFRDYYPKSQFKFGEVDAGSELSFPITEFWLDTKPTEWQQFAIDITINILLKKPTGDIMIFVKSGGDANKLCILLSTAINELRKKIIADNIQKQKQKQIQQRTGNNTTHKVSQHKGGSITKTVKTSKNHNKADKADKADNADKTGTPLLDIPPEYLINPLCLKLEAGSPKDEKDLATDEYKYKSLRDIKGFPYTRKIVITTNVAESSITVNGIVFIIDSGYEYTDSYEPNSRVRSLLENTIAQSAVKQRKGRAGRTRPGYCFHLYSKQKYDNFEEYPIPSIEKSDITNDILDLMKIPLASTIKLVRNLLDEFISPPHEKFILNSIRTLQALGAITDITPSGTITPMGFALTKFRSIKVNYARALIASFFYGCSRAMCDIIALVTVADGMLSSIFLDYYADKKKTPEWNKKESFRHTNIIKSYAHPLGDYMTLLKAYRIYLKKYEQLQPIQPIQPIQPKQKLSPIVASISHKKTQKQSKTNSKKQSKLQSKLQSKKQKNINIKGGSVPGINNNDNNDTTDEELLDLDDEITKTPQDNPTIKKWCRDNYLNPKNISKVKRASKQLYDTLMKTVRPYEYKHKKPEDRNKDLKGGFLQKIEEQERLDKLEPVVQRFATEDDNIMMALSIGNFVNFAIKSNDKNSNNAYSSCFAQNKKLGKINKDSFLTSTPKIIMYDELFVGSIDAKFVKINIVNKIPDNVYQHIISLYGKYIKACV